MANIVYRDYLVIALPEPINSTGLWTVKVDISRTGEVKGYTLLQGPKNFQTSEEAANHGLEMGKQWVDKETSNTNRPRLQFLIPV